MKMASEQAILEAFRDEARSMDDTDREGWARDQLDQLVQALPEDDDE